CVFVCVRVHPCVSVLVWVCVFIGLRLVEEYPYEAVEKGYDYVRLASIAAESEVGMTTVNRCLDAAKACNVDETCQKLRTEYVSACIKPSGKTAVCNRPKCSKALRKFFDRVPPDYTHELLFCPCTDTACSERRRQTIVPGCSYEDKEPKPNCLAQLRVCKADYVCRSRWAQFQYDCQPSADSANSCKHENYAACLLAYTGMIGSTITPNYLDNSTSNVAPWCTCAASGNQKEQCAEFMAYFTDNVCLRNAISAFGNGTDPSPTPHHTGPPSLGPHPQDPSTGPPAVTMETEANILRELIPTQATEKDRFWSDSTLPSNGLSDQASGHAPGHTHFAGWSWVLLPVLLTVCHH
ncbi:hypothetical protein GJAV_G00067970, partial [Gymnothorax javanicus]